MAFVPHYSLHTLHKSVATKHHYHHHNHHHHRHVHHLPSSASSPHAPQHIRVGSLGSAAHETRFTLARRGRLFEFEGHSQTTSTPTASAAATLPAPGALIPNNVLAIATMLGRHRRSKLVEAMRKAEALAHDMHDVPDAPSSHSASKSSALPLRPPTSPFEPFTKLAEKSEELSAAAHADTPTRSLPVSNISSVAELYAPASAKNVSNNSSVSELYKPPAKTESRSSVSLLYAPPKTPTQVASEEETLTVEIQSSVSALYAPPPTTKATQATDDKALSAPVKMENQSSVSALYTPPVTQAPSEDEAVVSSAEDKPPLKAANQSSVSLLYAPPPMSVTAKDEEMGLRAQQIVVKTLSEETKTEVKEAVVAPRGDLATVAELYQSSSSPKQTENNYEVAQLHGPHTSLPSSAEVSDLYQPPVSQDLERKKAKGAKQSFVGKAFQGVKGTVVGGIDAMKRLVSGSKGDVGTSANSSAHVPEPVAEKGASVIGIEEEVGKLNISAAPSQADIINTTVAQLYQPPPASSKSTQVENNTSVSVLYQPPGAA